MLTKIETVLTVWVDQDSNEVEQTALTLRRALSDKVHRLNVEDWEISTEVDSSAFIGEERVRAYRTARQIRLMNKQQKEEEQDNGTDSNRD